MHLQGVEKIMAITFQENSKRLVFDILGYQFPNIAKGDDDYDANWLTVSIEYSDGQLSFQKTDYCLLSFELEELIGKMDGIISGAETGLMTDFLEPYLALAVTKAENTYAVQIRYVYDTTDGIWKDVYICQSMSLQELIDLRNHFKTLYEKYPQR